MSPKSHIHKRCGTLRKKSFSKRGYAKNAHTKAIGNNKKYIKNYCIENPNNEHIL
jgi:hypothetical protein